MTRPKLIAAASGGGHWVQLLRLRPAFAEFDTVYVSTLETQGGQLDGARFHTVPDASRHDLKPFATIFLRAARVVFSERPDAVITTGSAPMLAFLIFGRMVGARTLWVDSIANPEKISGSGKIAKWIAHKVVTQWPEVAEHEGIECWGRVV